MNLSVKPAVVVSFINPQKYSNLFEVSVRVSAADTVADIVYRIAKQTKQIKGTYR
jgi:hypothetical protein